MARNKQDLWYANPTGWTYVTDSNGFKTGDKEVTYGEPVKIRVSIAPSASVSTPGSMNLAVLESYGIVTAYTHKALTDDLNCAMNEESRVWYGVEPTRTVTVNGEETTEDVPSNLTVVRKEKTLNVLAYYLKEVDKQ